MRYSRGQLLYLLGRWAEAEAVFASLVADFPEDEIYLGWRGKSLARLGRRDEALATARALEAAHSGFQGGISLFQAARIMVVLDRKEEGVSLLRQAMNGGFSPVSWHIDATLQLLRGFAPYEELTRIRG